MSNHTADLLDDGAAVEPSLPESRPWWRRRLVWGAAAGGVVVAILLAPAALGVSHASWTVPAVPATESADGSTSAEVRRLRSQLAALQPREPYVVIDTHANRLRVYRRGELLRDAVCSTGSGVVLLDPRGERSWTFDTPLGERRVQRKVRNPVWAKPDWAFIEEGYLPPKDPSLRFDDFSLGQYALYLGDGYIIHGTIFQTLLGRPVTHGCVRLGDEDLEYVYRTVPLGARVYLY